MGLNAAAFPNSYVTEIIIADAVCFLTIYLWNINGYFK